MSGRGGRAPSGPWGRLKPVNIDPLESYGLPSKGDNRLLDFKTQERYYTKIVDRYMSFCSQAGRGDELLRRLSSLHIDTSKTASTPSAQSRPSTTASTSQPGTITLPTDVQSSKDLSTLLMSLRKLREALVATSRIDTFSTQSYIFAIRLSILLRHPESYHPALLYLLRTIHPQLPLSGTDLAEFASYLVLDRACRQGDLAAAFAARAEFRLRDQKVDTLLASLVHDDYWAFWRVKRAIDGYRVRLVECAEDAVRVQALKCLGRTYLTADVEFVESAAGGRSWEELVRRDKVGWERQGSKVVIRRAKAAGSGAGAGAGAAG